MHPDASTLMHIILICIYTATALWYIPRYRSLAYLQIYTLLPLYGKHPAAFTLMHIIHTCIYTAAALWHIHRCTYTDAYHTQLYIHCWSAAALWYLHQNCSLAHIQLFTLLPLYGIPPDAFTLILIIHSCIYTAAALWHIHLYRSIAYIHIYVHIHTHIYIYIYIYMYTHCCRSLVYIRLHIRRCISYTVEYTLLPLFGIYPDTAL